MKYRYILFLVIIGLLYSCKPELDEFSPSQGSADFSTYVALGNSLTAGYADGALYSSGQLYSYPNILAGQLKKVGGGEFTQPLMPTEDGVGFTVYPPPIGIVFRTKTNLGYSTDCLNNTSLSPVPAIDNPDQAELQGYLLYPVAGSFNNMGVPGAKSFHLIYNGYGNPANLLTMPPTANPFYVRFASAADATVLGDALSQSPTFFSFWIGNNDVLLYAVSGGDNNPFGDFITPVEGNPGVGFNATMDYILATLTASVNNGVIANIPDIISIPFFTTVPYNGLKLTEQAQVDALNSAYGNGALGITFSMGQNPFVIQDFSAQAGIRQINQNELVLLTIPQDSLKCAGWGSLKPIPHYFVLTENEINAVKTATSSYNTKIKELADNYNLAFVDINRFFNSLSGSGLTYDGIKFTVDFVTGNAFSLDGIHLTPQGNAIIANEFITAINTKYGANIPLVSVTEYPGIAFP
jgi:lysophospholipase L1-like esterase